MEGSSAQDLDVCRACLAVNVKMYSFTEYGKLRISYETLLNIKIGVGDGMPMFVCYMCAAFIHKFSNFRQRCEQANNLLRNIVSSGLKVTEKVIQAVDRTSNNLVSPIDFWYYNNNVHSMAITSNDILNKLKLLENVEFKPVIKKENDLMIYKSESMFDGCNDMGFDYFLNSDEEDKHSDNKYEVPDADIDFMPSEDELPLNYLSFYVKKEKKAKTNKIKLNSKFHLKQCIQKHRIKKVVTKRQLNENFKRITNKINPKITLIKKKREPAPLNGDNWEEIDLTEEEQVERFRKKLYKAAYQQAQFPCDLCHRGFLDEDSFAAHKIVHNIDSGQHECWICKIRFKRRSLLKIHANFHKRQYKCKRCSFITVSRHNTYSHDKFHEGVFFECDECDLKFRKQQSLRTHKRISHRSECICALCGENFLNDKGLRNHQKKIHSPESIAKGPTEGMHCDDCEITFYNEQAHYKHLRTSSKHTGLVVSGPRQAYRMKKPKGEGNEISKKRPKQICGPVTCHVCNKQFRDDLYVKHFKTEHPDQEMHKRYMCYICGFTTTRNEYLENHLRTHSEQRNFACDQCDWKFKTVHGLHNHRVVHTKEKRYGCKECGKRFTRMSTMKLHYRTAHLKQPYPKRERRKKSEPIPLSTEPVVPPAHQGEFLNAYEYMVCRNASVPY